MTIFNATIPTDEDNDIKGYLAQPESGKGPGLILMHEVYGVTEGLKSLADRFAEEGFVVFCPNMYWRDDEDASFVYEPSKETLDAMGDDERDALMERIASDRDKARDLMFRVVNFDGPEDLAAKNAGVVDTINRVSAFLKSLEVCDGRVASGGFCFGGRNTYLALTNDADVDGGVAFYATPKLYEVFSEEAAAEIDKPMMFVYGAEDPYVNDAEKKMMRDAAGTVIRYGAGEDKPLVAQNDDGNPNIVTLAFMNNGHGFNRKDSKYSDTGASDHAISSAAEFLRTSLGAPKITIPQRALTQMPKSSTYQPQHKV